jgi:predicted RecB family nuclease
MTIRLSKSRLLAFRQCERRLWLELRHPELRQDGDASTAAFAAGHQVGDLARRLYDPDNTGVLIDPHAEGFDEALARSQALLATSQPVFEAGFAGAGALAFADILLPVDKQGQRRWRMVEVKSATSVKDYYHDDAAIQSYVALAAGVPLDGVAIAHIDKNWVYPGDGDYRGLLVEHDLTESAFARGPEVEGWIDRARQVAALAHEPEVRPGAHCTSPYACGFVDHCRSGEAQAAYPVGWLPKQGSRAFKQRIEDGAIDMRDIDDGLLNAKQQRVKQQTLANAIYFDAAGAAADLAPHALPAWFIDFETISFTVPIWKGTSPYQMIPFQFSVHRLGRTGELEHQDFLDLSGDDPSAAFAEALAAACGDEGPVFVYNAGFETARIAELAARFPHLAPRLLAIKERVVDLLPIARERYYHPGQQGSWSIKRVLPAVAPDLRYDRLDGVQEGGAAMQAYVEAIDRKTPDARRQQIKRQLLDYCHLDTLAMVRLWQFFSGTTECRT